MPSNDKRYLQNEEWKRNWKLVLASTIGVAFSVSHVYSLGALIEPIEAELGWSRSTITSGLTIVSIISVILAPFVGMLIDKIGTRTIGLTGMFIYSSGMILIALSLPFIWFWWSTWVILALGSVCIKPTIWTAAVASRFTLYRGLAFGIALSGTGIGAMLLPSAVNYVESSYGWRAAYMAMSAAGFIIALPMLYLYFHDARADHQKQLKSGIVTSAIQLTGMSTREALHSVRFYKLILSSLLGTSAIIALAVSFIPIMSSYGLNRNATATIAGLIGAGSIIGRLTFGFFLDKLNAKIVGGMAFLLPAISCIALAYSPETVLAGALIAFLIGLSLGGEIDVLAYLSTKYFGMKNYGLLFGCVAGMMSLASGMGPLFLSTIYDMTDSYKAGIITLIPVFIIVSILIFTMGKYPNFDSEEKAES